MTSHPHSQPGTTNPSPNAVTGSSGTHPVTEGAADNAPPAIRSYPGTVDAYSFNAGIEAAARLCEVPVKALEGVDIEPVAPLHAKWIRQAKFARATPAAEGRGALANDEAILHQFINNGVDGNRARQALKRLMDYNRSPVDARGAIPQEVQEACAQVADRHRGSYTRRPGYKTNIKFASDESLTEIRAEERGEDIAAEMIAKAIRALIPPAPVDTRCGVQISDDAAVNCARFVRWALQEGPWEGGDLDGGTVQEKAESLGLIVSVPYDPEKHGAYNNCGCDAGDPWFEFSSGLNAIRTSQLPSAGRKWDDGEHEGCGIDSQRALEREKTGHGCKQSGGFRNSNCTALCDCHVTLAFSSTDGK